MTKVKAVIKELETDGWVFLRMKGDHRVYFKKGCGITVVPGHMNDEMPIGTERSIKRKMGH